MKEKHKVKPLLVEEIPTLKEKRVRLEHLIFQPIPSPGVIIGIPIKMLKDNQTLKEKCSNKMIKVII